MRRIPSPRVGVCLALGWLVAGWAGIAAGQEQEPRETFRDAVDVRVFDVEVAVRRSDGQPATGLTREDFRLLVDGEPVVIDYFSEVRGGRVVGDLAGQSLPPILVPKEPREDAGRVGLRYLVFLDELSIPVKLRADFLRAMAREIPERLESGDQMAVVTMSGKHLRVLSPWTDSVTDLARIFKDAAKETGTLAGKGAHKLTAHQKFSGVGGRVAGGGRGALPSEALPGVGFNIVKTSQGDFTQIIDAAVDALYAFSETSGRKVFMLVSGGWPTDLEMPVLLLGAPNSLWHLVDAANSLGYTLYPVHVKQTPPSRQMPAAATTRHFSRANSFSKESLVGPAEATGGRLLSIGGTAYLERVAHDVEAYYWLGFTSGSADDERRTITVETSRPDLEVRSRGSFVHTSTEELRARQTAASLRTGLGSQELVVEAGPIQPSGRGQVHVSLALEIPVDALSFLEQGGQAVARLELRIASLDARGRKSPIPEIPVELALDAPPPAGDRLVYEVTVALRKARQTLQLTLADLQGEARLAGRLEIDP